MDQAWYKDVDDNVKKIEKALGLSKGAEIGKAQETAMLYVLQMHGSYFGMCFTKEDYSIMEQNIRDDANLFEGFHGPVSMVKRLTSGAEAYNQQLIAMAKVVRDLQDEIVDLKADYQGTIEMLQSRIGELQEAKYVIEGEWEATIARAEKAEVANLSMAKEIVRRKLIGKEELTDEERALVVQSL